MPPCTAHNALGLEFGGAAQLSKRPGSVWNCLWAHALKISPGINHKSLPASPLVHTHPHNSSAFQTGDASPVKSFEFLISSHVFLTYLALAILDLIKVMKTQWLSLFSEEISLVFVIGACVI